ncbi:MAG TPA: DUF4215 domain-containing protein [Myxococcota bacterium]|jgi:cysteine-rich repeat protein|nr:DUF4215 domain-containing protein [Myxococcota bacterium]
MRGRLPSLFLLASLSLSCSYSGLDGAGPPGEEGRSLLLETDGNDTPATATLLTGSDGVVLGHIAPPADNDYYAITAAAGDRLYAATMTSFDSSNTDTILGVYAADGATLIEEDGDNGSMSSVSSALAGVPLTTGGTYYLRVRHQSASPTTIRPYHLHWTIRSGAAAAEAEPNDDPLTAPAGVTWVTASLSAATDVDYYPVTLAAGDGVYAALDADPERDAVDIATATTLGFGPFTGVAGSYLTVNDTGSAGPDAEALFFTVAVAGTYNLRVTGTAAGTYGLSIAVRPAAPTCTTYTSTATPVTITDNATTVTTIVVPGNPILDDLDVSLAFTHPNPADLDVALTSPAGNNVALFNDIGTAALGGIAANLDDEASFPINFFGAGVGLAALRYQPPPTNRLSFFDGINAGGTWTLTVADDASSNAGSLTAFSLTICERPPACPAGTGPVALFASDFEANDGAMTHSGVADEWEWGTPSFAPITTCASGTKCWDTDLDNTYNTSASEDLLSPMVSLAGVVGPVYAQWAQKYQIESAQFDHLYASIVPMGGPERRLYEHFAPTMSNVTIGTATVLQSAGWATMRGDLTSLIGSGVQLKFHLDSDTSVNFAGYAVDDVAIFACSCGNGAVSTGETCDDSNLVNGDGCDANCTVTACGNGIVTAGETCDDGNLASGDGCDANCTPTACGNGVVTAGEVCDDGNGVNGDGCDVNCTASACGNLVVAPNEDCEDGNTVNGDGCDSNCLFTGCRNGIVTAGEFCDDGNSVNGDGCDNNCLPSGCGNGVVGGTEACDDGNGVSGDGCDVNCTLTGCGNGVFTPGEECEDGNNVPGDGCDATCHFEAVVIPTGCGDGVLSGSEACDDGNDVNGDGCDVNCTITACGNGVLSAGEACEDGNTSTGDGCDASCQFETVVIPPGCGDGVVGGSEACDDGNDLSGDGCDVNCTATACGNGVLTAGEQCEDGNSVGGDGCDAACQVEPPVIVPSCGDGVINGAEACDDGNDSSGDGCDANCTATGCGNGVLTAGEQCEDGNTADGDGCDSTCQVVPIIPPGCGNGVVEGSEACDDGNGVSGDGCDVNCTATACGNGVLSAGEQCEDGNTAGGDGCDATCMIETVTPGCGNGVLEAGEECEDGNTADGDGCDSACQFETSVTPGCGNGVVDVGEDCDDGNVTNGDGCDANCTVTACGNGILSKGEECEDGNTADGDGCDATCRVEVPPAPVCGNGAVETGETCDDGNIVSGDDCSSTCQVEPAVRGGCGCRVYASGGRDGARGAALPAALALLALAAARPRRRPRRR